MEQVSYITMAEINEKYRKWLEDTSVNIELSTPIPYFSNYISQEPSLGPCIDGNIIVVGQFYIDSNYLRQKEIRKCLKLNTLNNSIDRIILLNERLYSSEELGCDSDKIEQIIIGKRLQYSDVFQTIEDHNIEGYIVLCNSDIFFDASIADIRCTKASSQKHIFCLLRYEYDEKKSLKDCELFGPRADSQDTWIFHSNQNIPKEKRKLFQFNLGTPACDNKIVYLWNILGYLCYNDPNLFKTYHYHNTQIRSYNVQTKKATQPWAIINPVAKNNHKRDDLHTFNIQEENTIFKNYIEDKIALDKPFIIPRIAGVENNCAHIGACILQTHQVTEVQSNYIKDYMLNAMKVHAGIRLDDLNAIVLYGKQYLEAFHKCDLYLDWEPWGAVYRPIQQSHDFITVNFPKRKIWAFTMDVFHNIYNNPWTLALKGKRLLIISPFADSFREKLPIREKIYGIDLFPECEFVFLKPPQTQADNPSKPFHEEVDDFIKKVEKIKDDFDIALCSCGGYGNIICSQIYDMGKSAIYVGGVLQMYFGVYGTRWLKERPDILKLFLNEHWSRPKEDEKPEGHQKVENSCYW